jgi:hypothetical protein
MTPTIPDAKGSPRRSSRGFARTLLFAALCASLSASRSSAQTIAVGLDVGHRTDKHLNGVENSGVFGGLSLSTLIGDDDEKDVAVVFPIAAEARFSSSGYRDLNLFADGALRMKTLTFGAGFAFSWDETPEIEDATASTSGGSVPLLLPLSLGFSGFAKLTAGPQNRFFVQGRYTYFPADFTYLYKFAEPDPTRPASGLENRDVMARDNSAIRVGVGYLLNNRSIVRAQYAGEVWRYERDFDNAMGAYDHDTRSVSVGMSWYF